MKLSVIIPCLNAGATLATQLEALSGQRCQWHWEVIVCDNGSVDDSVHVARRYAGKVPSLRVIDASRKKGPSYARNRGVEEAKAEAVAFCDADDEVAPGWVRAMGDALMTHPVVHGQILFDKFNELGEAQNLARKWIDGLYREQFLPHAGSGNMGIWRSVHKATGGFDEDLPRFMDSDYCWRLMLEGYEFHYVPEAVLQYRIGRVNPSLTYQFQRGKTAAAADYWQYKRFRPFGMELPAHRHLKPSFLHWINLLMMMPYSCLINGRSRNDWLRQFAWRTGDMTGQLLGRLTDPCRPYYPRKNTSNRKHAMFS